MAQSETPRCENCPGRRKAEANPRSILGMLWRFHTKFCPGWKSYQRWLGEQAKESSS